MLSKNSRKTSTNIAALVLTCAANGALAEDGSERWAFRTGGEVQSAPALAADGTLYTVSMDGNLYAVSSDGTFRWGLDIGPVVESVHGASSPAIGADGTIFVGSKRGLHAVDPNGMLQWNVIPEQQISSCPAIGADGTIYVGIALGVNAACAFHHNGTLKWCVDEIRDGVQSAPAVAPDGTIYFQTSSALHAVDQRGAEKWSYPVVVGESAPAVAADGVVYVVSMNGALHAVNPDGTARWIYDQTEAFLTEASPSIGVDGTIYYAVAGTESSESRLVAINANGSLRWSFVIGGLGSASSPAIGASGTVFVGSDDTNLYAVNPDGTLRWAFKTGDTINASPAIGPDGTVYVGSDDDFLYAISSGSGGLAHVGWPMFHRDTRHTGSSQAQPLPNIKANGHDGSITVAPSAKVSIEIALNAGAFVDHPADWWLIQQLPSGAFKHLDLGTMSMADGYAPTYHAPLINVETFDFDTSQLAIGEHIFSFGVDLDRDGSIDSEPQFFDQVFVTAR